MSHEYLYEHRDWSPWFAWHPVKLENGGWRWLVTVQRYGIPDVRWDWDDPVRVSWNYQYRDNNA